MYQIDLTNQTKECMEWVQEHVFDNREFHDQSTDYIYISFENLNQLRGMNCKNISIQTENLLLNPRKSILLEENLNLTEILNMVSMSNYGGISMILIRNIIGFNQYQYVKKSATLELAKYDIVFNSGILDFYLNNTLITKEMCTPENFYGKLIMYFVPMKNIFFYEFHYSHQVCPYVFINSRLDQLLFDQITNSLIFKNRLQFIQIDENEFPSIGLNIEGPESLELNIFFEELTKEILCPQIFRDTKVLQITGSLNKIQTDLFQDFTKIELIFLKLDSLRLFFHQGIEWMSYLNRDLKNHDIKSNLNRIIILTFMEIYFEDIVTKFTYPDEDLCLFRKFPHKQLIIPSFPILDEIECSCTLIWLTQNYNLILDHFNSDVKLLNYYEIYIKNFSVIRCMKNYSLLFDLCRFEEKFNNCIVLSQIKSNQVFNMSIYDVFFLFEWLKLVIEVYVKPFLSCFGLITNILVLLVLRNSQVNKGTQKLLDNVMYRHIFYNSMFNFIFCLINCFSLLNICIFPRSSFCSSVYKTEWAQYFKIIFSQFLGNSIRLCSNFSFILFSISRFYISTSTTKSKTFLRFEKLNLKHFYLSMFVSCSLWSMFKLFEFRPNEIYSSFDKNFPYNRYDSRYCQYNEEEYKFLSSGCKIFPILNVINNVLNNILFLFISVVIDICLIRFANQSFEHKTELFHDKKHLEEALNHKKKIKKLIITNGFLFFISHILEFVVTLLLIIFKEKLKRFCFTYFSCTDIIEIFETFSLIGICLQFFVYKHFDHNFTRSFKDLKWKFF